MTLARLSQFVGIFGYFYAVFANNLNSLNKALPKFGRVKTYPLPL